MNKTKHYSSAEELFILDETFKHKTNVEAIKKLSKVFNVSESAMSQKIYNLRKKYPDHICFNKEQRSKYQEQQNSKKKSFFSKIKALFRK